MSPEDYAAIESKLGPENAAPIIQALEKIECEQKIEVKTELLMELATKADLAELKGSVKADVIRLEGKIDRIEAELKREMKRVETDLKSEIKRLEMLIKILIGLVVVAMGLFSPAGVELSRLIK